MNSKKFSKKNNGIEKEPIEVAAERLAEIIIAQIEFQRSKNKNSYGKCGGKRQRVVLDEDMRKSYAKVMPKLYQT